MERETGMGDGERRKGKGFLKIIEIKSGNRAFVNVEWKKGREEDRKKN